MRKAFQLVLSAIIGVSFLFPLVEFFDEWDGTALPSRDTELYVVCLIVGVGILFALRRLLLVVPDLLASHSLSPRLDGPLVPLTPFIPPCAVLSASPPGPLRI
jgi:hypothetical protein